MLFLFVLQFYATRETTKIGNAFANNMSTYIKLIKAKISKMIQSGVFFHMLVTLGKNEEG